MEITAKQTIDQAIKVQKRTKEVADSYNKITVTQEMTNRFKQPLGYSYFSSTGEYVGKKH